ncbi:MAG: ABC transporter permease [Acidimicrobiia bacterium]|nr:ABC transporter permease [Acidimicrobiia bacterium]
MLTEPTRPTEAERAPAVVVSQPYWRVRLSLAWRGLRRTWALFRQNSVGMIGLGIILLFLLGAIAHPILMATVWDPAVYHPVHGYDAVVIEKEVVEEVTDELTQIEVNEARLRTDPFVQVGDTLRMPQQPAPPSLRGEHPHLLGTDPQGRDILSQLLYSIRAAFILGALAAVMSVVVATTVGSVAAYFGGRTDSVLMRFSDLILLLPILPVLIVIGAYFQMNMPILAVTIGLFEGFGATAIVLKSQALQVSVKPFIDAARVAGGGHAHIIFRHLVPNVMPLSLLYMMFGVAGAIALESVLSFLGLLDIEMSWGVMLNVAQRQGYLLSGTRYWWLLFPAGLAVTFLAFAFFLVGRGMDEVINPRLRSR